MMEFVTGGRRDDTRQLALRCLRSTTLIIEKADRKSTRLNSSHANISYAVFCLKKKKDKQDTPLHAMRSVFVVKAHLHRNDDFAVLPNAHEVDLPRAAGDRVDVYFFTH